MTLRQWLRREGYGAQNRLTFSAGVSLRVILRALGKRATVASALKIHEATRGEVAVLSMLNRAAAKKYAADTVTKKAPVKKVRRRAAA